MNLTLPCKEWNKCRDGRGYGMLRLWGKVWRAHRLAWIFEYGYAPNCVLHGCDNPPCYELEHLFSGTKADNTKDRDIKGRWIDWRKPHARPKLQPKG